jgi:hypothetical protein
MKFKDAKTMTVLLSVISFSCESQRHHSNTMDHDQLATAFDGIWVFDSEEEIPTPNCPGLTLTEAFILQDEMLTIRLFTLQEGIYKSPDDLYKLKTKIENGTLYYLPPFGDWVPLAAFQNGHFVMSSRGVTRYFKKVDASGLPEYERGLLNDRPPHDYRIQPDGSIKQPNQ